LGEERTKCLVAFWSPLHGQCGNTLNMASVGSWIATNYVFKILLMHNQYEKSNLESAFRSENNLERYGQKGIDGIEKCVRSSNFCPTDFQDFTEEIVLDRLYLMQGSNKVNTYDKERLSQAIQFILNCGRNFYDLMLSDVNSGTLHELTNKVMNDADIVVVNLNQNIKLLKGFFSGVERHKALSETKKFILVLGNYNPNSKYTAKYIKKLFNYKDDIYTIPYNIDILDSHNDHLVHEFFCSNNDVDKKDENYYFISEVKRLSMRIMNEIRMNTKYSYKPIEEKSFIKSILGLFKEEGE